VVAGLHQQFRVGTHERRRHGHGGAVRQNEAGTGVAEVLDDAEQVVPAAGVQARGVVPQLVEDLVHLERRRDGLDQHGGADGALAEAEEVLGEDKDVVPQPGLEVALHLRQVVVRAVAVEHQLLGDVEEVQAEVNQRADGGFAVEQQVPLLHVPAAGAGDDDGQRGVGAEPVLLALGGGVAQRPGGGIAEVEDGVDDVVPRGCARVLKVGEPHLGAGVQGVDGHLGRRGRAGHLNPAVLERRRCRRNLPVAVAHVLGLRQEIQAAGPGHLFTLGLAGREQLAAPAGEAFMELLHERQGLRGENLLCTLDRPGVCDCDSHCGSFPGLIQALARAASAGAASSVESSAVAFAMPVPAAACAAAATAAATSAATWGSKTLGMM
jgi:hypothetical protein